MNCKKCQAPLDEGVTVCPQCGFDNRSVNKKKLALVIVSAVVVLAIVVGLVVLLTKNGKNDSTDSTKATETTAATEGTGSTEGTDTTEGTGTTDVTVPKDLPSYTFKGEDISAELPKVVATMGDVEVTNAWMNVWYWSSYYEFLNQYGAYATYMGLDPKKELDQQLYGAEDKEMTWQQMFLEQAIMSWTRYQALCLEAQANGVTLSEEGQKQLDSMEKDMNEAAKKAGFADAQQMIENDFGKGITLEEYKKYVNTILLASEYYNKLSQEKQASLTEEQLAQYYDENTEKFDQYNVKKDETPAFVNVRHILIKPEVTEGAEGPTDEQKEAARAKAQDILDQWKAGKATEESFGALAKEHTEDPGSKEAGGLYNNVRKGQMVQEFDAWCFDPARKAGDVDLVETPYGFHIMYFVNASEEKQWYAVGKEMYLAEELEKVITGLLEKYPHEFNYDALALTEVDTTSNY